VRNVPRPTGSTLRRNSRITSNYETTIQLKKQFFDSMKKKDKKLEIRKTDHRLERGDVVRFTSGYDPENGEIFRKVTKIEKVPYHMISVRHLVKAEIESVPWLLDYAEGFQFLYLIFLEEETGE